MNTNVIIMGKVMEKTYTAHPSNIIDSVIESVEDKTRSLLLGLEMPRAKVIENKRFKKYTRIASSRDLSGQLKVGDLIYIKEDNRNYPIKKISHDIYGNVLYFIDMIVDIVLDENIEQAKIRAQKQCDKWNEELLEAVERTKYLKNRERDIERNIGVIASNYRRDRKWWEIL